MDYELYRKIKKCNLGALRDLQKTELPWAYFVCYRMTGDTKTAAGLLRKTWMETILMILSVGGCPRDSFRACLAKELYRSCDVVPLMEDADIFSSFEAPALAQKFDFFIEEIDRLEPNERKIYLLNKLGDLGNGEFSEILTLPLHEAKEYLYALERKTHPRENGKAFMELMHLSNEFKGTNGHLFEQVTIPELFISTLEHDYHKIFHTPVKNGKNTKRKDSDMKPNANTKPAEKNTQPNRRAAAKKKKTIIISCVAAVLAIALIITLVVVIKKANTPAPSITTTYKVQEVTVGNVSTTISGSGSLTPVTSKTFAAAELLVELEEDTESEASAQAEGGVGAGTVTIPEMPDEIVGGTIQTVNVQVGDTVAEGDVIAVIVFESEETRNILAPYNAVILEWYLHEGDEVADDTGVGMFMGTDDGYTMTISVDENNISAIELGQDVEISVDASGEEMPTGSVTDISYNGSTSGSATAYKITVTFDYVEGTYPGMSVSAEVVIEDSGEGLLVPVSAIQTSGDTKYVYLAPDGAALADTYEDGDIDISELTKVTVTTGMSNGTYIMIESSNLEEGDLIMEITRTSTLTGSDSSDDEGGRGGMGGGMPDFGGSMPDFGGSMPDFGGSMPNFGGGFPFGN